MADKKSSDQTEPMESAIPGMGVDEVNQKREPYT